MKAFLCVAVAALLVMGVAQSVAVATPPAHKQAVVYTSMYDYQYGQREKIDACAKTTITLAESFGMTKAEAAAVFNECILKSGVMI
jgi:opacity protein-like surface antigen